MNSASIRLINNASRYTNETAIIDNNGEYSYRELLNYSYNVAAYLLDGNKDLTEARVAFIVPSSFEYVATQWGIWRAGGVAVPLCVAHPDAELKYVIDDSQADMVVVHPQFAERMKRLAVKNRVKVIFTDEAMQTELETSLPDVDESRRAMIIYTSGTTSRPKGVVATHKNIRAQIACLIEVLRTHPDIEECAVVGVKDTEWGERVCALLVTSGQRELTLESLRQWAKERLAPYKVPTQILKLDDLPRNAMGKATKPKLVRLFEAEKETLGK